MAKATSTETAENEPVGVPEYLKVSDAIFEKAQGDTFGGASEILVLEEGAIAGPLKYAGHRLTDLGNGLEPVDMHESQDAEDETWRLPIAANFRRQAEGANLQRGDTFYLKRLPDAIKKGGKGKGNPMQMYQIKVIVRAPVTAPTA